MQAATFARRIFALKYLPSRTLPARISQILDLAANNQLRVKVDTIDESLIVATLQKTATRITLGLIIAALLIGASLLMRVETKFTILGYPGLAMIFFIAALVSAIAVAWQIVRHDRSQYAPPTAAKNPR